MSKKTGSQKRAYRRKSFPNLILDIEKGSDIRVLEKTIPAIWVVRKMRSKKSTEMNSEEKWYLPE